jgi:hypothetical protein
MEWYNDPDKFIDPISKKWMSSGEWQKKYGDERLACYLFDYSCNGTPIPDSVMAEIMEIGKRHKQENKEKFKHRIVKEQKDDTPEEAPAKVKEQEWFAKVDAKITENMKKSDCHRTTTGLLLILLMHRSWRGKKDKHRTWYYWHQERKLIVSSISKTKLAELMGVSLSTIYRHTNRLIANGDIGVEIENGENVYVLGFIDDEGKEVFYYTQANEKRGCQICEKDMSDLTDSRPTIGHMLTLRIDN